MIHPITVLHASRRQASALVLVLSMSLVTFGSTSAAGVHLSFTTSPPNPVHAGTAFPVSVHVQDDGTAPIQGVLVTLDIDPSHNPGGDTLDCGSGTALVSNASGDALFKTCKLSKPGTGYELRARASGATTDFTAAFDVEIGPPAAFRFAGYPANPTPAVLAPQPIVEIVDAAGNVVTSDTRTIALTINKHAGTFSCTGGLSKAAVSGVATFTGCQQTTPDTGYRITANDGSGGLPGITGAQFAITIGPAAKLLFCWGFTTACRTAPPTNLVAGAAFSLQPSIQVADAAGNAITTDSTTLVTLSIAAGTPTSGGPGTLTCSGGLTRMVSSGVATFSDCRLEQAGTNYRLEATSSPVLVSAKSNAFDVAALGAVIDLTTQPSSGVITWGSTVVLNVHFTTHGSGKTFQLQVSRDKANWSTIATLTTNTSGNASFGYRPSDNRYYRASFGGSSDLAAAMSPTVRVVARQINLLRPTNLGLEKTIHAGTAMTFTSTVRPNRPELPQAHVHFVMYRLIGSVWVRVLSETLGVDSFGIARLKIAFSTPGEYYVRSQAVPTTLNANSVWSRVELYRAI